MDKVNWCIYGCKPLIFISKFKGLLINWYWMHMIKLFNYLKGISAAELHMQAPDRRYLCKISFEVVMLLCLLEKLEGILISQKFSDGWVQTPSRRTAWSVSDVLQHQHTGTRVLWWPNMQYQSQKWFEVICCVTLCPEQRLYNTSIVTLIIDASMFSISTLSVHSTHQNYLLYVGFPH